MILRRLVQMTGCGNREAWCQTLTKVMKRENFPTDSIAPVLWRYLAWQASTSKVEQTFSKSDFYNSTGRSGASCEFESRSVRLLSGDFDRTKTCAVAQKLYSECAPGRG